MIAKLKQELVSRIATKRRFTHTAVEIKLSREKNQQRLKAFRARVQAHNNSRRNTSYTCTNLRDPVLQLVDAKVQTLRRTQCR